MLEKEPDKKIAIILFNLGGPDSPDAVKPFLYNLFSDKYIISLPKIFRNLIAWIISSSREKTAREIYAQIGGKSPILKETTNQANALQKNLEQRGRFEYKTFVAMRHWHPYSKEVIKEISDNGLEEIILIPMYPQFSTTTTGSFVEEFKNEAKKYDDIKSVKTICCYPCEEKYIESPVALIEKARKSLKNSDNSRILFSAHGLPEKIVKMGDPYQWQIEKTVAEIIKKIGINDLDYKISYQSRVGPLEWLKPNTEEEIKFAVEEGKSIVIVPIAFVSEHVETLVELDIEYSKLAKNTEYVRVPTVRADQNFIDGLADIILSFAKFDSGFIGTSSGQRICPLNFNKCLCNKL